MKNVFFGVPSSVCIVVTVVYSLKPGARTNRIGFGGTFPRGPTYTTIVELGPKRPSLLWFWGPNSIVVVHMDPLGL